MKKQMYAVLAVALVVMVAGALPVRAGDSGRYVSVKAAFSYTVMNSMRAKGHWEDYGISRDFSFGSGSGNDTVFGGSAALGYDFFPKFRLPIRAEAEYSLFGQASDTSTVVQANPYITDPDHVQQELKVNAQTVFLNAYYDFRNQSRITPYLGVGAGMAFVRSKGNASYTLFGDTYHFSAGSHTRTNFAYNLTAGISICLTKSVSLDLSYRFADLGKAKSGASAFPAALGAGYHKNQAKHVYMHQALVGLRFSF